MIAELGLAALWLAAALAALQMIAGFLTLRAGNASELVALIPAFSLDSPYDTSKPI